LRASPYLPLLSSLRRNGQGRSSLSGFSGTTWRPGPSFYIFFSRQGKRQPSEKRSSLLLCYLLRSPFSSKRDRPFPPPSLPKRAHLLLRNKADTPSFSPPSLLSRKGDSSAPPATPLFPSSQRTAGFPPLPSPQIDAGASLPFPPQPLLLLFKEYDRKAPFLAPAKKNFSLTILSLPFLRKPWNFPLSPLAS